jgi:hypothetical protein
VFTNRASLGGDDSADPGIDAGLGGLGNAQRRAAPHPERVLDVQSPEKECNGAQGDLNPAGHPQQAEHVEPRGHEGEVDDATHHNEDTSDQGHPRPASDVDQEGEQEEQHPHGARVEAVEQPDHGGEGR